jgi:two-component system, chemotaxis family, chemotaxis protein CheY
MKTALLVDDARTVRRICRGIVESLGFTVHEAENGQEALDTVRTHPEIELILLDWNMPVMDGLTFLRTLRGEPLPAQPRVVMCTTEAEFTAIATAIQAGADEYIMKPFTEEIVREKVEAVANL